MSDPARSPSDEDDVPLPPSSVVPGSVVPGGIPGPYSPNVGYSPPPVTSEPEIPMSVAPSSMAPLPNAVPPARPAARQPAATAPQPPATVPQPPATMPLGGTKSPPPKAVVPSPPPVKANPPKPTAPASPPSRQAPVGPKSAAPPAPPAKPAVPSGARKPDTAPSNVPPARSSKSDPARKMPAPTGIDVGLPRKENLDAGDIHLVQNEVEGTLPKRYGLDLITASPWMVSMLAHMLVVLLLALIILPQTIKQDLSLTITYAETLGDQLALDLTNSDMSEMLDEPPVLAEIGEVVEDPLAAPPEISLEPGGQVTSSNVITTNIGNALTGREDGRAKEVLLGVYGGDATTEGAVGLGLEWLKRNQLNDGTWSLKGPYSEGALFDNKVSATAMALLAFQGAGNTPTKGKYKDVVAKGWKALLAKQNKEGFFEQPDASINHRLYAQGQAMIALCELYGMTQDSRYREPAQAAVDYAQDIQAEEGGWRYQERVDSDTSVTGWFLMGLQSARMSGLQVKPETLKNVERFLDSVQDQNGERYRYQPTRADFTHVMTAEALLCRQYLGWSKTDERLLRGADYFRKGHPFFYDTRERNVYYWYYATQVLHHLGGKRWEEWNNVMRQELPENQIKTGKNAGSWDPDGDDRSNAGRLYVTCLSIYMLEVYYRHMPLYGLDTG